MRGFQVSLYYIEIFQTAENSSHHTKCRKQVKRQPAVSDGFVGPRTEGELAAERIGNGLVHDNWYLRWERESLLKTPARGDGSLVMVLKLRERDIIVEALVDNGCREPVPMPC